MSIVGEPAARGHQEVAVAVQVAGSEGERPLQVGADQGVAQDPLPVGEHVDQQVVELGVRRDGHRPRVEPGIIGP
jgi:hypothetical protein